VEGSIGNHSIEEDESTRRILADIVTVQRGKKMAGDWHAGFFERGKKYGQQKGK
jgi:hypothetical protein